MKEILFKKNEADFIIKCLQKEMANTEYNLLPQDVEILKEADQRIGECERLIKKLENSERQIKHQSAKGKGRNLQYWVCERIAQMFGVEFVQSDDNCPVHSREMGQHGTDIALRGELQRAFPFDIECKATESLSLADWIRQARANNKKSDRKWLVVFKKQTLGTEPVVCMDWSAFEWLWQRGTV